MCAIECDRPHPPEVIMSGSVPDLELDFRPLVILCAIIRVKDCRFIEGREFILNPCHHQGCLPHMAANKDDFDGMFLGFVNFDFRLRIRRNHLNTYLLSLHFILI